MKETKIAIITGSAGLVGVESVRFFSQFFDKIIGIDNDSRGYFFGKGGSVAKNISILVNTVDNYEHYPIDIRDRDRIRRLFEKYGQDIKDTFLKDPKYGALIGKFTNVIIKLIFDFLYNTQ
jgi:NAD(P)-dependent dehydrogenase (short-subunit alcohol dehydrogenase family)